jgi:hypothetical protein
MNMFVSTAAVAAAPAAAAPANSAPLAIDHRAILARVEEVVDLLRTRYVREGWKIDEERAECALAYFRRHVEGPPFKDEDEDTIEYHRAIEFFGSHGQSLDWIHDGNPGGMICGLAKNSQRAIAVSAASSTDESDPIFAAIEAHKAARTEWVGWVHLHGDLEEELPKDKRLSNIDVEEEKIVETDDPRWIEAEQQLMRTSDAEESAAINLVCIQPTTRAGVVALLDHAIAYDTDGEGWPRGIQSDDGQRTRNWHYFLIENLLASKTVC